MKTVLDLGHVSKGLGARSDVFLGRETGRLFREWMYLDKLDRRPREIVEIIVPKNCIGVTQTFLKGLLYPSIETLGVKGFRNKYFIRGLHDNDRSLEHVIKDYEMQQRLLLKEKARNVVMIDLTKWGPWIILTVMILVLIALTA